MKKFYLFILLASFPIFANAYDFCVNGIYYNFVSIPERTVEVTNNLGRRIDTTASYDGSAEYTGVITIPPVVTFKGKTLKIIGIGSQAFYGSNISEIILPEGLEYIEESAFRFARSLRKVTLPKTLKKIGLEAFQGVSVKGTFSIPSSIVEIGAKAFPSAENIIIESSNQTLFIGSFLNLYADNLYIGRNIFFDSRYDYKVEEYSDYINYKGYNENTNMTITIGSYVNDATHIINTLIGDTIDKIVIKRNTPPLLRSKISEEILVNVQVKVPSVSLVKYQNAQGWRDFFNLEGE